MGLLENQIAIITGGGRGIGAATAKLFAQEGAQVLITSRTQSELDTTQQTHPNNIHTYPIDLSIPNAISQLFQHCITTLGSPTILINNAAKITVKPFEEHTENDFDSTATLNIKTPFFCAQEAFKHMKNTGGHIINISSLGGIRSTEKFPGFSSYCTSKHAIIGLTECIAVEGKPYEIRCNAIAPGAVDTQMLKEAAPGFKTNTTPEDIAQTLLYLANPATQAITGSTVEIFSNN